MQIYTVYLIKKHLLATDIFVNHNSRVRLILVPENQQSAN